MKKVDVKIKLIEDGMLPVYKTEGAVCADAYARAGVAIDAGTRAKVPLGFAVEIPEGYEIVIRPRSGLTAECKDIGIGTIDYDYRGEVSATIINNSKERLVIGKGMRVCQLALREAPVANWVVVDELSETERGEGGFGHTGLN